MIRSDGTMKVENRQKATKENALKRRKSEKRQQEQSVRQKYKVF